MFQARKVAGFQRECQKLRVPAFLQRYADQMEHLRRLDTPMSSLRLVVLDTETTGLNVHRDHLLTVGAVVIQGGEIRLGESLEIFVSHEEPVPMRGSEVHGLTLSDFAQGIPPIKALAEVLDFLGADILVGQHIGFDAAMLEQTVSRLFMPGFQLFNHRIDTATLAYKVEHPSAWRQEMLQPSLYNLDALCDRYQIPVIDRHTAWGDALATAELFLKLSHKMEKQGRRTLRQFIG